MNLISTRLAARSRTRQAELVGHADAAALAVDRAIARIWQQILQALRDRHQPWHLFQHILSAAVGAVDTGLRRLAVWGHTETVGALTGTLSAEYLRVAAMRQIVPAKEGRLLEAESGGPKFLPPKPGIVQLAQDALGLRTVDLTALLQEPVRDEFSAEQQKQIFQALLFPPPDEDTLERIIYQPVQGVTWRQRLEAATRTSASPQALASIVQVGFGQGKTPSEIARDLLPVVDGVRSTARRIARTEGMRVSHAVQMDAYQGLGDLAIGYQIHATMDQNVRSEHAHRNGRIFYKEPKGDQPGLDQMPNPPLEADGSMAWNCYLGSTEVQGIFRHAFKIPYSGQIFKIITVGGRNLSVTPNHRILSEKGFIAASLFRKGNKLLAYRPCVEKMILSVNGINHRPMMVEEVFGAFEKAGMVTSVHPRPTDLHGDAQFGNGKISVVNTDRPLLLKTIYDREMFQNGKFLVRDRGLLFVNSSSTSSQVIERKAAAPVFGSSLSPDLFPELIRPRLPHGFCAVGMASNVDACLSQSAGDSYSSDAHFLADLNRRFSREIEVDEIADIQVFDFTGHVYDLQSKGGFVIGNNIWIGNCRCHLSPVLRPDPAFDDPSMRAAFTTATDKLITDPVSFQDWFKAAPERNQRIAVGTRRYSTVQNRLGRTPEWTDFIHPDTGELLPLTTLRHERDDHREARVGKVQDVLARRRAAIQDVRRFGFLVG